MRIRHVVQTPGESAPVGLLREFEWAQRSIYKALENELDPILIDMVAAHLPGERPVSGPWTSFVELPRDSKSIGTLPGSKRLPFLADVIDAFGEPQTYDFGILTNADIMLHPSFYLAVRSLLQRDPSSTSITRRSVYSDNIDSLGPDFTYAFSLPHPGHDCIVAHSSIMSKINVRDVILGAQFSDIPLIWSLQLLDDQFRIRGDLSLTFHRGDDRAPLEGPMQPFALHNMQECRALVDQYRSQFPNRTINNLKHVVRLCSPSHERNLFKESPRAQFVPPLRKPQFRGLPRIMFTQVTGNRQKVALKEFLTTNSRLLQHVTEYRGATHTFTQGLDAHVQTLAAWSNNLNQSDVLVDVSQQFTSDHAHCILEKFDHEVLYFVNFESCTLALIRERCEHLGESEDEAAQNVIECIEKTRRVRRLTPQVNWVDVSVDDAPHIKLTNSKANAYLLEFRKPYRHGLRSCDRKTSKYDKAFIEQLIDSQLSSREFTLCQRCRKSIRAFIAP